MINRFVKNTVDEYRKMQTKIFIKAAEAELNIHSDYEEYLGNKTFSKEKRDKLFDDCARVVVQTQVGSTAMLQRRFNLGYNRAGRIMDQLESAGIVGSAMGSKPREVYVKTKSDIEIFFQSLDIPSNEIFPVNFYEENNIEIGNLITEAKNVIDQEIQNKVIELSEDRERQNNIEKEKIRKVLIEKDRRKKLHKEVYLNLLETGQINTFFINENEKREPIPQEIMDKVWNRDGGKCVLCNSRESLEFDHIIPHSKGGATSYRNLQILCKACNVKKSNDIGLLLLL